MWLDYTSAKYCKFVLELNMFHIDFINKISCRIRTTLWLQCRVIWFRWNIWIEILPWVLPLINRSLMSGWHSKWYRTQCSGVDCSQDWSHVDRVLFETLINRLLLSGRHSKWDRAQCSCRLIVHRIEAMWIVSCLRHWSKDHYCPVDIAYEIAPSVVALIVHTVVAAKIVSCLRHWSINGPWVLE